MFKRGEQKQMSSQNNVQGGEEWTLINKNTTIQGSLNASGRVRIHGKVLGDVIVEGVLEIAEEGLIEGALVRADEVKIIGKVKANIESKGKIEIWQTGQLEGDVRARALEIDEGAMFIGRSDMRPLEKTSTMPMAKPIKAALEPS